MGSLVEIEDPELAHALGRLESLVKKDPKQKQGEATTPTKSYLDHYLRQDPDQVRDWAHVAQQRNGDPED